MGSDVADQSPHRAGALMDHLARLIRVRSESVLTPLGLRPRHLLALTVLRDRGGLGQQALASTLDMDGTNIVGLLNDLETEGLVERKRSAEDRRRHIVKLTDTGLKRLGKAENALAGVEDEVFSGLNPEQRETLYCLLQQASIACGPAVCTEAASTC